MIPRNEGSPDSGTFGSERTWWLFMVAIIVIKLCFLLWDPVPKIFMGDSASYLLTAVSGWIPPDRSFLYGFLVRWLTSPSGTLTPLLIAQTIISAATALVVAVTCLRVIKLSRGYSYFFGLLCALDPLQWLWERYVMTEVMSLFVYVVVLFVSFRYLKERRLGQLVLIQVLGVALIALRISYLLVIQASTVLLPLVAFFPEIVAAFASTSSRSTRTALAKLTGLHLAISLALLFSLHGGYKVLNGRLSHREPNYLYATGLNLIAMWAPALEPADSPDPRLAGLIAHGDDFEIKLLRARGVQRYREGFLVRRWQKIEPNVAVADRVAKETAMRALVRRPFEILMLAKQTFFDYWQYGSLHHQAIYELGTTRVPEKLKPAFIDRFHLKKSFTGSYTFLQQYFLAAQPYYYLVLIAPFVCAVLLGLTYQKHLFLILVHGWILLGTSVLFTVTATVRYLQPLSVLALLTAAAFLKWMMRKRSESAAVPKA